MAYQVTARKWRPQRFDEVVGQDHITTTLQNALTSGRIAQSYLFCGPRGVGKTTMARILAKALNCSDRSGVNPCNQCNSCRSIEAGTSMNVLEIDGASNNSVDDVRELREVVRYVSVEGTYKIYIIDEVHMLSTPAFNALLKTLEEPPAHVIFIFATTEAQGVPETILSRCQRFNFRRIPVGQIAAHLEKIAGTEGIEAEEEALFLLANRADGALRDAESLFDQVVSFDQEKVSVSTARQVLGLVDRKVYFDLDAAIGQASPSRVLDVVARAVDEGVDLEEFVYGLLEHLRYLLFVKVQGSAADLELSEVERRDYEETASAFAEEDILRMLQVLMDLESALKHSAQPRLRLEMALVRLALMGRAVDVGQLLRRLQALEDTLHGQTAAFRPAGRGSRSGPPAEAQPPPPEAQPLPPEAQPPPAEEAVGSPEPTGQSEPGALPRDRPPQADSPTISGELTLEQIQQD